MSADVVRKEACAGKAGCNPNDITQMVEPEIRKDDDPGNMSPAPTVKKGAAPLPSAAGPGPAATAGTFPGHAASSEVQMDPNWRLIARSVGALHMTQWKKGMGSVADTRSDFIDACLKYDALGTGANVTIRLTMGSVVDYFQPTEGKTLCNMLVRLQCLRSSLLLCPHLRSCVLSVCPQLSSYSHRWSATPVGPFHTPEYLISDFYAGGGSTDFWLRRMTNGSDVRKYVSFWGSADHPGGCCADSYSVPSAWGKSYQMYLYIRGPMPGAVPETAPAPPPPAQPAVSSTQTNVHSSKHKHRFAGAAAVATPPPELHHELDELNKTDAVMAIKIEATLFLSFFFLLVLSLSLSHSLSLSLSLCHFLH